MYPTLNFEIPQNIKNININNIKKKINLKIKKFKRDIKILKYNNDIFIIIGRPIIKDKVNFVDIPKHFEKKEKFKNINGEFLIIRFNDKKNCFEIINDRFASIHLFYFTYKKKFYGSVNYIDIFKKLNELKILKIKHYTFYEFLIFQRLFGTKTYDKKSEFLGSSFYIKFQKGKLYKERYWWPSKIKSFRNYKYNSKILSDLIDQSIKRKFSGKEDKIAFFLSGGVDSRSILYKLSKIKKKITAFTFAPYLNNEAKIAKEVSGLLGVKYNLVKFGDNPYKNLITEMSSITSLIYEFDHSLFLNLNKKQCKNYNLSTSGFGVDSFFQGLMIPFNQVKIFGLPTHYYEIDKEIYKTKNLSKYFIKTFMYRLKTDHYKDIIFEKHIKDLEKETDLEFKKLYSLGKRLFKDNIDIYNFMCLNNPSRHFTYNNALSMNQRIKNTCIMYDNDLLDYYYTLPGKKLAFKKVYKSYYKNIPKELTKIRTGNDNLSYDLSAFTKTVLWYYDKILTRLKIRKNTIFWNPSYERTWPDRGHIVIKNEFKKYINKMLLDGHIFKVRFIDKRKLSNFINKTYENPNWHNASVIYRLISINEFLKEAFKKNKIK